MRSPYLSVDGNQETALRGIETEPTRRMTLEASRMKTVTPVRTQDTMLPSFLNFEMPEALNTKMLLIGGALILVIWLWRKLT